MNTRSAPQRQGRTVTVTSRGASKDFDPAFILSNVEVTKTGCWEWTGSKVGDYGQTYWASSSRILTHRLSYQIFVGDIAEKLFICHHCDNPPCCNPDHIYAGTIQQNNADTIRRGRARYSFPVFGPDNMASRPQVQLRAVRKLGSAGLSGREIGRRLGIPPRTVQRWLSGESRALET